MKHLAWTLTLLALPAWGRQDKPDQARIDAAIEKGAHYLMQGVQRGLPKVTHTESTELACDELVLYTLIHAGTDPSDPQFQKLVERVETATGRRSLMRELAPPDRAGLNAVFFIDVVNDGQAYAYTYQKRVSRLFVASGVSAR